MPFHAGNVCQIAWPRAWSQADSGQADRNDWQIGQWRCSEKRSCAAPLKRYAPLPAGFCQIPK